jgi:hypothetical protein
MCDECQAIDLKVKRYRELERGLGDRLASSGIDRLIVTLERRKAELHQAAQHSGLLPD